MLPNPPLWLTLLAFVCALGPLVFFHELGHYGVARLFKIPAETFSIGFGKALVSWTDRQGTQWKIGWLPLGGYVKFVGDMSPASTGLDEGLSEEDRKRAFQLRPVWQRFLVVLAGPMANFLLAIVIFAGILSLVSAPQTNRVGTVKADTAASAAGIQRGDRILSVAGRQTLTFDDVRDQVAKRPGEMVRIKLDRDGEVRDLNLKVGEDTLTDATGNKVKIGLLGVSPGPISIVRAIPLATVQTVQILGWIVEGVGKLIVGEGSREDVGGPIKIAQFAGQAASLGPAVFFSLLALFSINLGFINLLPVPMLDGGHLFFYAVEAVRKRPLSERALEWAFRGGLALILALVVFTTINDLGSLGLWDRLQRLIG